jgi:hypothetical protein
LLTASALLDGTNGNTITNSGTMQLVDGAPHPGGNFQGTLMNKGTLQILSKGKRRWPEHSRRPDLYPDGCRQSDHGRRHQQRLQQSQLHQRRHVFVSQQLIQGTGRHFKSHQLQQQRHSSTPTFPRVQITCSFNWAALAQAPTPEPSKPRTAECS